MSEQLSDDKMARISDVIFHDGEGRHLIYTKREWLKAEAERNLKELTK